MRSHRGTTVSLGVGVNPVASIGQLVGALGSSGDATIRIRTPLGWDSDFLCHALRTGSPSVAPVCPLCLVSPSLYHFPLSPLSSIHSHTCLSWSMPLPTSLSSPSVFSSVLSPSSCGYL